MPTTSDLFGQIASRRHLLLLAEVRCPRCEELDEPVSPCDECQRWRLVLAAVVRTELKADQLPSAVFEVLASAAQRRIGEDDDDG